MEFRFTTEVLHPVADVYAAYRDELTTVARGVENLDHIEQVSRVEIPGGLDVANTWFGRGIIPAVARQLISPDMLVMRSWTVWHDTALTSDWLVAPRHFAECVRCAGELRFVAAGPARTRIVMTGELTLSLDSLSLVPRLMRAFVEEQIEKFLLAMGEPNHGAVAGLFDRHLAERPPAGALDPGIAASVEARRREREHRVG